MNIREIVQTHLTAVITESSPVPMPDQIGDDALLEDFWLDSIAFVALLGRIEKEVGYIPSDILEGALYPRTFGELVSAYASPLQ